MKSSTESYIAKLFNALLKLILSYLKPGELFYPIMQVNKKLYKAANDPMIMTTTFFHFLKVHFDYGGIEFSLLRHEDRIITMKNVLWKKAVAEKLPILAYYTDGGTDGNTSTYFIQNIYIEKPTQLYCSIRPDNVNIKSMISESIMKAIDLQDIKKYKPSKKKAAECAFPEHTYSFPIKALIGTHEPHLNKQFAVMKFHDIKRNLRNYTCFLQSFVIFVSMKPIYVNHPLVKLFDSIKNLEQVNKLGFEYSILQEAKDTKVIEFNLRSLKKVEQTLDKNVPGAKLNGVYPLIWGDVSKTVPNYLNLEQPIGFKYILMKLIDSHKTQVNGNIDCYTIGISGNLIKLMHTYEE